MPGATPSEEGGFFDRARALSASVLGYLEARLRLAGIEGKETAANWLRASLYIAGAVMLAVFAYFFLCLGICFAAAWALGGGQAWIAVALAMAALHVAGALGCFIAAREYFAKPAFPATLDEINKDRQWLTRDTTKTS